MIFALCVLWYSSSLRSINYWLVSNDVEPPESPIAWKILIAGSAVSLNQELKTFNQLLPLQTHFNWVPGSPSGPFNRFQCKSDLLQWLYIQIHYKPHGRDQWNSKHGYLRINQTNFLWEHPRLQLGWVVATRIGSNPNQTVVGCRWTQISTCFWVKIRIYIPDTKLTWPLEHAQPKHWPEL